MLFLQIVDSKEKCKYSTVACEMIGRALQGKEQGAGEVMDLIKGYVGTWPTPEDMCRT